MRPRTLTGVWGVFVFWGSYCGSPPSVKSGFYVNYRKSLPFRQLPTTLFGSAFSLRAK
jgi:hypothetical protein